MKKFWSYVVFVKNQKFWIVKYPKWYCLVWWWNEKEETSIECLKREIYEEIWEKSLIKKNGLIEIPNKYSFTITKDKTRKWSSDFTEEHTIYVMNLPVNENIKYKEKGKNGELVRLDKGEFLSEKVMPFKEFREFLSNNVMSFCNIEKSEVVLSLHLWHNSSASISVNWEMKWIIHEEKFDNIKNSWFFPSESIKYLIQKNDIKNIPAIVVSSSRLWKWILNYQELEDRNESYKNNYAFKKINNLRQWLMYFIDKNFQWIKQKYFMSQIKKSQTKYKPLLLENIFKSCWIYIPETKIHFSEHHISHALSPILFYWLHLEKKDFLIFTLDWSWDKYCATVSIWSKWKLNIVSKTPSFSSIWYLRAYVTMWLWMQQLEHEYKVMWLAAYSSKEFFNNDYEELFKKTLWLKWMQWKSNIPMNRAYMYLKNKFYNRRFDNIAGALQFLTEDLVISRIKKAIEITGISDIVVSWWVFMNVKLNKQIQEIQNVKSACFMPSCWDESNVIGATLFYYLWENRVSEIKPVNNMYLWIDANDSQFDYKELWDEFIIKKYEAKELPIVIADLLESWEIIWICTWKGERGARSLWNRAIIASPNKEWIVNKINMLVKKRDFRMPFAPSILYEHAEEYIKDWNKVKEKIVGGEKYMITAFDTTFNWQKVLNATMHSKDMTIRPQLVSKEDNPFYYEIINAFREKTGIAAVLNTSLNVHHYPLSGTLKQALFTFKNSGLKYILLNDVLMKKKNE